MFKKLHAKLDEILAILKLLSALMADGKATMAVVSKDVNDGRATLAQVQALTGHTATVAAMIAQASVPTVAVVLPPAPTAPSSGAAPTLQADLKADVAKVNPLAGVHLPGAP